MEIVKKLREKLKIAEENDRKRVRLFDEIIRETVEEHKKIMARLPKRRIPRKNQRAIFNMRRRRRERGESGLLVCYNCGQEGHIQRDCGEEAKDN